MGRRRDRGVVVVGLERVEAAEIKRARRLASGVPCPALRGSEALRGPELRVMCRGIVVVRADENTWRGIVFRSTGRQPL